MSAHVPQRTQHQISPTERAFLIFFATMLVLGGAYTLVVAQIPPAGRTPAALGGGLAVTIASVAAALAAYYFATARRSHEQIRRSDTVAALLEREVLWLADEALPTLGRRTREGATVPGVLAEMAQPSHPAMQRLLQSLGRALEWERHTRVSAVAARAAMENELSRLADEQLPALVEGLRSSEGVSEVALAEVMQPSQPAVQRLWREIARELGEGNRQGAAAMAACASAAARVQAQVTSLLSRLRELEDEYGEQEDVFAHLLDVDHRISQLGRLADNIALLSGGRSGRRWTKPIVMESVLRGAIGRIGAFRRVRLHSTSTAAVAGYAAEGVMHALAELIDNATKFSPHGTTVHVYVEEEDAGVVVTIEDSGLGMRPRERRLADTLVSRPLNLTTLSNTRLGLAVVGRLASKYGLTVNFRPSARGGIGVVVLIPRQLIMHPHSEEQQTERELADTDADALPSAARDMEARSGEEEEILPKRRRGQTLEAALRSTPVPSSRPVRDGPASAARLAAFRRSVGARRDIASPPEDDR